MADAAEKRMTVAEFLRWDDGTDTRYELIDGCPVAMAPAAPAHSVIAANLSHELRSGVRSPCYVGNEAGVQRPDRDDTFYEADVIVSCTPVDPGRAAIPDPVLVVEVLSPSTIEHDRGRKAYDYSQIDFDPGDRPGFQRAAPCGDLAAPRHEVGSGKPDR